MPFSLSPSPVHPELSPQQLTFLLSPHLTCLAFPHPKLRSGETAAIVARELAEQTKGLLHPGDVPSTVRAMAQLVELLDVQLRNLTPGGKDSAARSLTKVTHLRARVSFTVISCFLLLGNKKNNKMYKEKKV